MGLPCRLPRHDTDARREGGGGGGGEPSFARVACKYLITTEEKCGMCLPARDARAHVCPRALACARRFILSQRPRTPQLKQRNAAHTEGKEQRRKDDEKDASQHGTTELRDVVNHRIGPHCTRRSRMRETTAQRQTRPELSKQRVACDQIWQGAHAYFLWRLG